MVTGLGAGITSRCGSLSRDFGRYLYLPRLHGPEILMGAVQDGVALLTWESDSFALAESHDEAVGRYRGLQAGQTAAVSPESPALLVKPDVARRQLDAEVPAAPAPAPGGQEEQPGPDGTEPPPPPQPATAATWEEGAAVSWRGCARRRTGGTGRRPDRREVISHLSSLAARR